MNTETKICQNCKKEFVIEAEDFAFYGKMQVPPPTRCPECRLQRRLAWRNERALHKRTCDRCKKEVIGIYPQDARFLVYCQTCWWSDKWDPLSYAREYNPSRPFFEQFAELQKAVPRQHTNNFAESTMINSPYTNCSGEAKNCYLIFGSVGCEDCMYSHYINDSRACVDCLYCMKSEKGWDCLDIEQCYGLLSSQSCVGCSDSQFLFDCRNCNDCIGCVGLRGQSYSILNQKYSKEEYAKKKAELAFDTREGREKFAKEFYKSDLYRKFPRKYYHGQMNKSFSGDYIAQAENSYSCFYAKNLRGCKYCFWYYDANDAYDCMAWGESEEMYECVTTGSRSKGCKFSNMSWDGVRDIEYCDLCFNSTANCFGCIGLRGKQYCILNKQYSKEEYLACRARIEEKMRRDGEYGEFFPMELSPFPYQDSVAQEHYPREIKVEKKEYKIGGDILACSPDASVGTGRAWNCTQAFRLTPAELAFYAQMKIPHPTACFQCRHAARVALRNPLKLWHRKCMKESCTNEFETSYSPDRPEIIYCEQHYNQEVI